MVLIEGFGCVEVFDDCGIECFFGFVVLCVVVEDFGLEDLYFVYLVGEFYEVVEYIGFGEVWVGDGCEEVV